MEKIYCCYCSSTDKCLIIKIRIRTFHCYFLTTAGFLSNIKRFVIKTPMPKQPQPNRLILASQSPRRRYLLEQAGLNFEVIPSTVDEDAFATQPPEKYVKTLALAKADQIARQHPACWVIGADTIVLIDGLILGKPDDGDQARHMLRQLSGNVHQVLTGFAVRSINHGHEYAAVVSTRVHFKNLSADEIEWYVQTAEPFDKAGAYAIQGLGTFLVRKLSGSYTNVVGLPVCEVIEHLIQQNVIGLDVKNGMIKQGSD